MNIPTIAFADTDSPLTHVDVAIPANNKGKHAVGVLYYLLARMVLQMRGTVTPASPWDVPVDLFFYRDPEEVEAKDCEDDANAEAMYGATGLPAPPGVAADAGWDESAPFEAPAGGDEWGAAAAAPAAAAPGGEWEAAAAPAPAGGLAYAAPDQFGGGF